MSFLKNELAVQRRVCCVMAIVLFVAYTLICAVVYPVSTLTSNDIMYSETVIPMLLEYAYTVVELFAISAAYGLLIFGVFAFSVKEFGWGVIIFIGATVYKYALNTFADWAVNGSVPAEWLWDVADLLYYSALEAVQLIIVLVVVGHIAKLRRNGKKGYLSLRDGEYPFANVVYLKNPYLGAAFACAVTDRALRALVRLINDVYTVIVSGFPEKGTTWLIMGLTYVLEIAAGVLCYGVIVLILSRILGEAAKNKAK